MPVATLETDYLVVGAGASGMGFTDTLIADSDADVIMVDRRHAPGGHWNDAYPFVRLHQPSATYGVNSRVLGSNSIDETGPDTGFYERATGAEIRDYYQRVLAEELLPSGRVRFFGMCDFVPDGRNGYRFVSRLTGEATTVKVRRKLVDATYIQSSIPATHTPSFAVDAAARLVTPNELVRVTDPGSGYTVIGAGKTSMDTCVWLLDNGVAPEDIRWVRKRDPWTLDRAVWQPLSLLPAFIDGYSRLIEAAAQARDVADLLRRAESTGQLVPLDPEVEPEVFRGATLSGGERDALRSISRVVRGRVLRLGSDEIVLEDGSIPTDRDQLHVDCTAAGLPSLPPRPVFEPGRITVQPVQWGNQCFNAAVIGYVEASQDTDEEKNELCPACASPGDIATWLRGVRTTMLAQFAWQQEPDVRAWVGDSRLNMVHGLSEHREDPRTQAGLGRMIEHMQPAIANLGRILAPA